MKRTLAPHSFLLGSAIAALLTSPAAFAGNTWDGGGGTGLWNTNTNWNLDIAPSTGVANGSNTFATAFNALHSFDFNTADSTEGWTPTMQARSGRSYTLGRSNNLSNWISDPVVSQVQGSPLLTWQVLTNPGTPNEFFRMRFNSPLEMPDPLDGGDPVVEIGSTETTYLDNGVLRMGTPTTQGGSMGRDGGPGF